MTNDILARAAYNNALWCDAVCATHGGAGEFHEDLWIQRRGAPRYYPDVVTLRGAESAAAQTAAISALVRAHPNRAWAVKDSFRALDLRGLGFTPLFDAQWICATARAQAASPDVPRERVGDEAALLRWEQSWSEAPTSARSRLFRPALLSDPGIEFVGAVENGAVLGGGVLNRGGGVVGLTNVFARAVDLGAVWGALADRARSSFPGLPIVAYEQRTETREAAYRAGFAPLGPLRIWVKPPTEPN